MVHDLLRWYRRSRRDLPWRQTTDPYSIWVSEVMLQQTRVDQAQPYYLRFLRRFPSLSRLANASLDQVLHVWQGLGYYRRASYLHEAAGIILRDHGGKIPDTEAALSKLPGFGSYTIGAVLSMAYGVSIPCVDANTLRVVSRLLAITGHSKPSAVRKIVMDNVKTWIPEKSPGEFNQALMELGAVVCKPSNPLCAHCCLRTICRAYQTLPDPGILPYRMRKPGRPHHEIAVGIVYRGDRVLITKRPANALLGNLWEFPGGKLKRNESARSACRRELREELGISVHAGPLIASFDHHYSHFSVTLHFFECRLRKHSPRPTESQTCRWVDVARLHRFAFPQANRRVIRQLQKL